MNAASLAAYQVAKQFHGEQQYQGLPYVDSHVAQVVAVLRDHGLGGGVYEVAGWLHDVVEDTPMPIALIHDQFGCTVGDLVWAVTGEGETRKLRNASIYRKIEAFPLAATLKVADRIANVEASEFGSKHRGMYRNEAAMFDSVVRPFVGRLMMERLDAAYDRFFMSKHMRPDAQTITIPATVS
jgi:(p)ppGpp synthase/HD superfamily hydrolase